MALAPVRKKVTVRIKKGQRIILPSDASIVSITEVDGALATSLCDLPAPTPTRKVTFFFERRLDYDPVGSGNDLHVYVESFHLADNLVRFSGGGPDQDAPLFSITSFKDGMYSVPGVIKLYICSDCAGSGCNNAITVEIPENLPDPYFVFNFDEGSADPWFTRVYPIDLNQPGQVPRSECGTLIPR